MALILLLLLSLLLASILLSGRRRWAKNSRLPLPPGPKGWPVLGNLPQLGAKPHQTLYALSRSHGPLLRLRLGAVEVIVASSAAIAEELLRAHDANFSSRPPNSGAEHVAYNYQDLVFAPYGPRWRMLRRLCALQLFSRRALDDFRLVRAGEVVRLVRGLAAAGDRAAVDVGREANACTTNALARALVAQRVFGCGVRDRDEAAEGFKEMVVELMRLAGVFNVGDFVPALARLDLQGVVGKMKKLHRRFDEFLDRVIAEHRSVTAEKGRFKREDYDDDDDDDYGKANDMLSMLIKLKEGEGEETVKLTDTDIKALLLNLFVAGTDTTSSTVEWGLAELIRRPELLSRAQNELDAVVGRGRLVSEPDLPSLSFLQAIIKETFRLHPSTPLSLPRIAADDCEVAGFLIPGGATLLVNVWAIGRDPAAWPDGNPAEFRPERFLPGGLHADVDVKGNDFGLIPFGAGRRICAGMSLGVIMVQLMLATLVQAFDWVLPDGHVAQELDMEEAYGLTLRRARPLLAKPVPRLAPEVYGHKA